MKYLIWIPGLFWLFPSYVTSGKFYKDYPETNVYVTIYHGVYTGIQILLMLFGVGHLI